jgi:hypothetical protein
LFSTNRIRPLHVFVIAAGLVAVGCAGPSGRVMDDDEPVGVDIKRASTDVLDTMMAEGVPLILGRAKDRLSGSADRHRLIFAGIQNNSDERLGEKKDYLYDTVDTLVGRQGTFDMVSRTFVENVLDQMGKQPRVELLLDPQVRRGVIERFEQTEGREYIGYILWGKLNNATTRTDSDERQKKYVLVLEMVDVKTGLQLKEQVSARKEYEE